MANAEFYFVSQGSYLILFFLKYFFFTYQVGCITQEH